MSDVIEVLKDMISYRKKGIDEFIELHKTGGESILEIEIRTLKEALLALEQKEKFVKILRDINYLMEGKCYIEVISFTNKWIKELEEGVEKQIKKGGDKK